MLRLIMILLVAFFGLGLFGGCAMDGGSGFSVGIHTDLTFAQEKKADPTGEPSWWGFRDFNLMDVLFGAPVEGDPEAADAGGDG